MLGLGTIHAGLKLGLDVATIFVCCTGCPGSYFLGFERVPSGLRCIGRRRKSEKKEVRAVKLR